MRILNNLLSLLLGVGQKKTLEELLQKSPFKTVIALLGIILTLFLSIIFLILSFLI